MWPTLLPEEPLGEIERSFIDNSPPDLWPDNQDSNFGQIRKVLTDPLQECSDFLTILYYEMFVQTSSRYLDLWEELVGLPTDPTGLTIQQRRELIMPLLQKGPWTRKRRNGIIERYILLTMGDPIKLYPEGVEIVADGIPIYPEHDDAAPLYKVYETVEDFFYSIHIRNDVVIDEDGLTAALKYVQPSGLDFDIQYVVSP